MKTIKKAISAFAVWLATAGVLDAQSVSTFEMRYLTSDPKANGETDFHGKTEWMNLDQRIHFLRNYANFASRFWGNPELDHPLLENGEATDALQRIKPQPLTNVRHTLRLDGWKAYGHRDGKAEETRQ